jgi:hypothetical protein
MNFDRMTGVDRISKWKKAHGPAAQSFALRILSKIRVFTQKILDNTPFHPHFGQYLQGFRVFKKVVIMTCTKSALCAIIEIKLKIMNDEQV